MIVNAASHSLLGLAGLSGALLAAAGPDLRDECAALDGCALGEAKITKAYRLPVCDAIHVVGPVWYGGYEGEDETLARSYKRCLALIEQHGHETAAFPSLGTGITWLPAGAGYPHRLARNHELPRQRHRCQENQRGLLRPPDLRMLPSGSAGHVHRSTTRAGRLQNLHNNVPLLELADSKPSASSDRSPSYPIDKPCYS